MKHKHRGNLLTNAPAAVRNCAVTTRTFAQWNLILARLQHSKTLEKHENKKLFELIVYFGRIFVRFYTYFKAAQSL